MTIELQNATEAEVRALIESAFTGDRAAMASIVEWIAPVIHVRVARALMRRHSQAKGRNLRQELEDLVQEVFASLLSNQGRGLRAWDASRGLSFLNFVGFLAEREVGMVMRTGKRSPWTEDPTMDDTLVHLKGSSESHADRVEARELLGQISVRLREKLSPQGRHYFQLLFVEDRSVQAVAAETGTSLDALYAWRSRLGKLLRQLRDELAGDGGPHGG
jgi:RNA polymerase sigma-70 factor (ECF subfamily)